MVETWKMVLWLPDERWVSFTLCFLGRSHERHGRRGSSSDSSRCDPWSDTCWDHYFKHHIHTLVLPKRVSTCMMYMLFDFSSRRILLQGAMTGTKERAVDRDRCYLNFGLHIFAGCIIATVKLYLLILVKNDLLNAVNDNLCMNLFNLVATV